MNITKKMLETELQGLIVLKNKLADAYNKNLGAIEAMNKMLNSLNAPEPKPESKKKSKGELD